MLNKMPLDELNIIHGGKIMKCSFCKKEFTPITNEDVCEDCKYSVDELSNGKGDEDDENI